MAIFVNEKNEILIGSSPRDGGYKIPQGGLESGETPVEGVRREVMEELGVTIKDSDLFPMTEKRVHYHFPKAESQWNPYLGQEFYIFKIQFRESMNPTPQDDEFDKLIWVAPENFKKYNTHHRAEAYEKALRIYGLLSEFEINCL